MPGYYVHIASATDDLRSSILGIKGVIAPDLWKWHTPTELEYREFFTDCLNAPTYEQVKKLCSPEHGGTHLGSEVGDTNHANFKLLETMFDNGEIDANNLFFKGYVHHLKVDYIFYSNPSICDNVSFERDFATDKDKAMSDLHCDWDKTNYAISKWYPETKRIVLKMPEEVRKVINFVEGDCKYISLEPMKDFIEEMRKPRSLEELLGSE